VNAHADVRTLLDDSMSDECLFSITPLPGVTLVGVEVRSPALGGPLQVAPPDAENHTRAVAQGLTLVHCISSMLTLFAGDAGWRNYVTGIIGSG
jgi:hypothetical protein